MITATEMTIAARMHGMEYGQFSFALECGTVTMPPMEDIRKRIVKPKVREFGVEFDRPVCRYDLDGEFICSYENVYKAAEALGKANASSIKAALRGRYQSAHKSQWRYMGDPAPGKLVREMVNPYDPKYWVEKPCKHCGKMYKGPKNSRYCSDECKAAVLKEHNKKKYLKNRELWQPQELVCPYCGIKFMPTNCHQVYCSVKHRKAAEWLKLKAKKAQNRK